MEAANNRSDQESVSAGRYIRAVLAALICSAGADYYILRTEHVLSGISFRTAGAIVSDRRFIFIFLILCFGMLLYVRFGDRLGELMFRYRYLIAAVLFCLSIIFELSGSSVGIWAEYLGVEDQGLIAGISRPIRSDEWAVSTPLMISQYKDYPEAFSYYSNLVRGTATDVFLEYGQPVKNILMIYRPFYLGYLFLPIAKGMAFFWCGRLIALFLVSFEFGRYLTGDKKGLSAVYAAMLALAPTVQWWFAINGLVEMLIYAQLSVLMVSQFMKTEKRQLRILYTAVIVICAGGYVLTFYPAWQVPGAYLILGLLIRVVWDQYRECRMDRYDWMIIAGGVFLLLLSMLYLLHLSGDTVRALMNTVYPGKRFETGGGSGALLFNYLSNLWYPTTEAYTVKNLCISAEIISLFPLGILLLLYNTVRRRKADHLSLILLVLWCFIGSYCVLGFPHFAAGITLMSYSTAVRARIWFGIINLIMLIYELSRLEQPELTETAKNGTACVFAAAVSCIAFLLAPGYYSMGMKAAVFILLFMICRGVMDYSDRRMSGRWNCLVLAVMLAAGGLANPIRSGTAFLEDSAYYQHIEETVQNDRTGKWAVIGYGFPIANLPIMAGAPTINSTNVYPNEPLWNSLDPEGQYEEIYNRYVHTRIVLKEEGSPEFTLDSVDVMTVTLTLQDLRKTGVTYLLCDMEQPSYAASGELTLITNDHCIIYKIN